MHFKIKSLGTSCLVRAFTPQTHLQSLDWHILISYPKIRKATSTPQLALSGKAQPKKTMTSSAAILLARARCRHHVEYSHLALAYIVPFLITHIKVSSPGISNSALSLTSHLQLSVYFMQISDTFQYLTRAVEWTRPQPMCFQKC